MDNNHIQINLLSNTEILDSDVYDLDKIIYDLNSQIDLLSNKADKYDYIISIGSGILCGVLDILWVGEFNLERGRNDASEKIDSFVIKTAKMFGCNDKDLSGSVKFLEKMFPIPSDGNTPDFGGGLQHHLRDFAHHPTIIGLMFSLLTQFTCKSYGTDINGNFCINQIPEKSLVFIGKDIPTKIIYGTFVWFFHLVSDMAGSSYSAGKSGGTGIPGPILSLAKELSSLPIFINMNKEPNSPSLFLSKLFNGTLLALRDEKGSIIEETVLKFDLRAELGISLELGRQAIPVIANECIVRCFYFLRHLAMEIKNSNIQSIVDIKNIDWSKVKPLNNSTISRMLTISSGVFMTLDIGEALVSQKYWVSINYVGVGRFAVAIGEDVNLCLKTRNVQKIKAMYEDIKRFSFTNSNKRIYERMNEDMNVEKLGLTTIQTEILYNLEYFKTLNDIENTKLTINNENTKQLKSEWLDEWKTYMTNGFSSFLQVENAKLHWYHDEKELIQKIEENEPHKTWFRLILLEAMLFEPYYTLGIVKNKKGKNIPNPKYKKLQLFNNGYKKGMGDTYLDLLFKGNYYTKGYVFRLRKCYNKVLLELNEVLKAAIKTISITAIIAIGTVATAGAFAPSIAVALVGSNFAGLSGAALTSACLAYIGGGAIAAGGFGMAGGTVAIVCGGAVLGIGLGAGVGGTIEASSLLGKKNIILQSAKLLVSVREIFLNDEHDIEYSNSIYEQYLKNITEIEKSLVDLKLKADVATRNEKKELKEKIKEMEQTVEAMKIARKSLLKFNTSFIEGYKYFEDE